MKKSFLIIAVLVLVSAFAFCESDGFAGGSFGVSMLGARAVFAGETIAHISFSGYGYASLTESLFIGGFGEGFGGRDTVSGYGGLVLGLWPGGAKNEWYLLNFLGIGLLGYRDVQYVGMSEELSVNYGIFLSDRFLLSLYIGLNVQTNLSGAAFSKYLSIAPMLGTRIDFGRYANLKERR